MKKPELLAPAGNMDSLKAAVAAGCDAVYLGGKMFGARSYATNFNKEELSEAVKYCHLYGIKLYVTVNTLIYENEVEECLNYIRYLYKIGVDAVIMQDIGMIDLVRKQIPGMDIHASTQAHIHNLSGTLLVQEMGLTRTVLARETSIEEIKYIKDNTEIELEIFIHGALCISYSGQCLMSSLIGGRSGNRGSCAGSCRLQYDLVDNKNNKLNKDKYLLSTKDLNSLDNIGSLIDIGVDSLKIEGRMKRPEYVYMVVSLYRKAIDSYIKYKEVRISDNEINDLKKIFNRGFTKGFLFNDDNNNIVNQKRPNHMGILIGKVLNYNKGLVTVKLSDYLNRGDGIRILGNNDTGLTITNMFKNNKKIDKAKKGDIVSFKIPEDVLVNSDVLKTTDIEELKEIENKIINNDRKVPIKMQIKLRIGEPIKLKIKDEKNVIILTDGEVYESISSPLTRDKVIEQMSKLGNTIYKLEDIIIKMDKNIFVNIKDLNEIRRKGIELLNEKRLEVEHIDEGSYHISVPDFKEEHNLDIKIPSVDIYNKIKHEKYHTIYVDDVNLLNKINDSRIVYMLPRVNNKYTDLPSVQVEDIGGIREYNTFSTGAFLNVTNSYSLAFLHSRGSSKVTLSYELTYDNIKDIINNYKKRYHKNPNVEVVVYGRIEAMICKYNLIKELNNEPDYYLKDRFNNNYPIKIKDDKMIIYNYKNTCLEDNYFDIGVNNIRYDVLNMEDLSKIKFTK